MKYLFILIIIGIFSGCLMQPKFELNQDFTKKVNIVRIDYYFTPITQLYYRRIGANEVVDLAVRHCNDSNKNPYSLYQYGSISSSKICLDSNYRELIPNLVYIREKICKMVLKYHSLDSLNYIKELNKYPTFDMRHVFILKIDFDFFVIGLNSTNHMWINGKVIKKDEELTESIYKFVQNYNKLQE